MQLHVHGDVSFPGISVISAIFYWVMSFLKVPMELETVCQIIAPLFGGAGIVVVIYQLTKAIKDETTAIIAASFISLVPCLFSITVAGRFDEGIS